MYTERNFKTKKELVAAVKLWNEVQEWKSLASCGAIAPPEMVEKPVHYYQPGPFGGNEPTDGTFCVEGPHYPEPHRWYATCTAKNGVIIKVR
jgi:hypothetical protein